MGEKATLTDEFETAGASKYDRRSVMRRGAALGAGIAGAGALARLGFAQEQSATPAAAAGVASPAASPAAGDATPGIVSAANTFLGTLSDSEKSSVLFDWSDTAQKQRWSNFPQGIFQRAGLMWGDLNADTQDAWFGVMQATLSTEGYKRVMAEWAADDALAAESTSGGGGGQPSGSGGGPQGAGANGTPGAGAGGSAGGGNGQSFGRSFYWIALIGSPSESDPWQWQWGGHHVTINATVVGANLSLTPSFIGAQPATFTDSGGTSVRPLGDIEDEAFALINSLDSSQQRTAILGDTYVDLVLGPGQDGKTIQAEGLAASQMTDDQVSAFKHLIGHYTGLANDEDASSRTAEVLADIDSTYFAWYGPTAEGSPAYFRVTGPKIVIEYSPQGLGGNAADHIHGIYRDPTNDYGAQYTGITIRS